MQIVKMKCLKYFFITIISLSLAETDTDIKWRKWKHDFSKHYSDVKEEAYRRTVWERNRQFVESHSMNTNYDFKVELNKFADQEIPKRPLLDVPNTNEVIYDIEDNLTFLPSSFDWRTKGAIPPVENQGMIGSSLSLVAKDSMMSYGFLKNGMLINLSLQEIVDCCTHGTGLMGSVFDCIHGVGGLCTERDYPSSGPAGTCRNTSCHAAVQNKGTIKVPTGREDQLQVAVLHSPVMVGIDASHTSFQLYRSGVYDEPSCNPKTIDHVVLVVGYGSQDGKDFWIVRNSWGANWGMQGYILMSRNKNNQCGIATIASYPD